MKTLDDIKFILRRELPSLLHRYGVRELGIFGSWVRGEQTPDSDLDLLVEFNKPLNLNLLDYIGIQLELSDALEMQVDLVMKKSIKPALKAQILAEVEPV